jgi:hypothetical protein
MISATAIAGISALVRHSFGEKVLRQAKQAIMMDIELLEGHECFIPQATMVDFEDVYRCPVHFEAGAVRLCFDARLMDCRAREPHLSRAWSRSRMWAGACKRRTASTPSGAWSARRSGRRS